jgi:gamma-glutamylcyclotransferase (GGCT)/AIG2-like uncharacterized protein YtfP
VFVYGTLKKGLGNHRRLDNDDSTYLGRAHIKGNYCMVDLGFPAVIDFENNVPDDINCVPIIGEVWQISAAVLDSLDMLEGHPLFYTRRKVDTLTFKKAWCYFAPREWVTERNYPIIPSGIFMPVPEELEYAKAHI